MSVELMTTDPQVLSNTRSSLHGWRDAGAGHQLSPRQAELLQYLADGKDLNDAAMLMGLSRHSAKNYAVHIREKLNAENTLHAAIIALRNGLIT